METNIKSIKLISAASKHYSSEIKYKELGFLLAFLRALSIQYHHLHWVGSKGENFYGDHLLYERIYKNILDEIDQLGERLAVIQKNLLNSIPQTKIISTILKHFSLENPEHILEMENVFIYCLQFIIDLLRENNKLTVGFEQLLGDIGNTHEMHTYLLKQRFNFDQ